MHKWGLFELIQIYKWLKLSSNKKINKKIHLLSVTACSYLASHMVCNNKKPFIVDIHTNSTRVYYIKAANLNRPHAGEQVLLVCCVDRLGCRYDLKRATRDKSLAGRGDVIYSHSPGQEEVKRSWKDSEFSCLKVNAAKSFRFHFGLKVFFL